MASRSQSSDNILRLAADLHDGLLDEQGIQLIERHLENTEARQKYLDYVILHALLEVKHEPALQGVSAAEMGVQSDDSKRVNLLERALEGRQLNHEDKLYKLRSTKWAFALLTLACTLCAVWLGAFSMYGSLRDGTSEASEYVAVLTNTARVKWLSDSPGEAPVRLRAGTELQLLQGLAEVTFSSGAVVVVRGPADLELVSPMHVRAQRGTVRARVGEEATGFFIETPTADVVDLGTEFGVDVTESGGTDVVVFEGAVDLAYHSGLSKSLRNRDSLPDTKRRKRLQGGEALHVDRRGSTSRIVSVDGDYYPTSAAKHAVSSKKQAVITGVSDNIRDPNNAQYYQIVHQGLREDVLSYVDRFHEWNGIDEQGIPHFLLGADYVMTFNSDKWQSDIEIDVDLSCPSSLYVFYDNRLPIPDWLAERFSDTGFDIGVDEGFPGNVKMKQLNSFGPGQSIDTSHSIWRLEVPEAGTVKLGALAANEIGVSMYGIAALPLSEESDSLTFSFRELRTIHEDRSGIMESIYYIASSNDRFCSSFDNFLSSGFPFSCEANSPRQKAF